MARKKNLKISYENLLNQIDAIPMIFSKYHFMANGNWLDCSIIFQPSKPSDKILLLRHDIDGQFDKAVAMAEWEAKRNIRTTYFVFPSAPYFEKSSKFVDKCKTIQDLGHEIGIHNNALRLYLEDGLDYHETLGDPLNFLRTNGINIRGTSAHFFDNCQMWEEFDRLKYQVNYLSENFPKANLADYGLEYEAYFVPFDVYLSDSGRKMSGLVVSECEPFPSEHELRYSDLNKGLDVLDDFNRMDQGTIQVLIHPQSWRFRDDTWTFKEKTIKPYTSNFPKSL